MKQYNRLDISELCMFKEGFSADSRNKFVAVAI